MQWLNEAIKGINGILWGYLLIYLLLGVGFYFTVRSRFVQVRLFVQSFREMFGGVKGVDGGISPFQAFATGLASRVGTGNIAGVAVAISLGGPGAIFWMWMTALVGMASSVVECSLAQLYKVKHGDDDNTFRGGPAYYIQQGIGSRPMGIAFALALVLCFGLVFNAVQTNSIRVVLQEAYGFPAWTVGLGVTLLAAPAIFGGVRSVAVIAGVLVPVMAVVYLAMAGYSVIRHIADVPGVFMLIVKSAFGLQEAAGGLTGFAVSQAMTMGIKRGLFSNEAGMGSAPNAAATATANHPVGQALLQMLGAFIDTIVVCSATAFMILLSGAYDPAVSTVGPELTQLALTDEIGAFGKHFLAVAIFFFGYSSILGNYAYAEGNVEFIHRSPRAIFVFKLIVLGMVYFGAVGKAPLVWNMADMSQGIMAIINLVAILLLGGVAMKLLRDYESQLGGKGMPEFKRSNLPELEDKLHKDVW
ncbi:alanine/glycine:cation symporter family protein [Cerasicoccus fimbriatus]|uniref:alanine/glycine:cation symporter family protein n=1 Tax=Cerasicoccus fimbriatus TaxID=3014554 RepID=UPI0022B3D039|nr:alanine/glycine:cation symporter family protein [Cerasicoccus sp. TK19100]